MGRNGLRGVNVIPHDIDIIVHTKDFFKVKHTFADNVVEPFIDNKGTWVVRYFGRLCLNKGYLDIAADEKMNLENHKYEKVNWQGYDIFIEPLKERHKIEVSRNRIDRISAIEEYIAAIV